MLKLINADCTSYLKSNEFKDLIKNKKVCVITDPPFNMNYHYNTYKDNLKEQEYIEMLKGVLSLYNDNKTFVIVHYSEMTYKLSIALNQAPIKVVSWVYNSNTAKQHRDICFFGIKPDFNKVRQPYKNPNDKRIKERIAKGIGGGRLYDWWNINQIKNVSKKDNIHPCVMPTKVMENIIGILPSDCIIIDPFMGSGTTGIACKKLNRDFIGIEIDKDYYDLAKRRINDEKEY